MFNRIEEQKKAVFAAQYVIDNIFKHISRNKHIKVLEEMGFVNCTKFANIVGKSRQYIHKTKDRYYGVVYRDTRYMLIKYLPFLPQN